MVTEVTFQSRRPSGALRGFPFLGFGAAESLAAPCNLSSLFLLGMQKCGHGRRGRAKKNFPSWRHQINALVSRCDTTNVPITEKPFFGSDKGISCSVSGVEQSIHFHFSQ